jgi:hypothetical protein
MGNVANAVPFMGELANLNEKNYGQQSAVVFS